MCKQMIGIILLGISATACGMDDIKTPRKNLIAPLSHHGISESTMPAPIASRDEKKFLGQVSTSTVVVVLVAPPNYQLEPFITVDGRKSPIHRSSSPVQSSPSLNKSNELSKMLYGSTCLWE